MQRSIEDSFHYVYMNEWTLWEGCAVSEVLEIKNAFFETAII